MSTLGWNVVFTKDTHGVLHSPPVEIKFKRSFVYFFTKNYQQPCHWVIDKNVFLFFSSLSWSRMFWNFRQKKMYMWEHQSNNDENPVVTTLCDHAQIRIPFCLFSLLWPFAGAKTWRFFREKLLPLKKQRNTTKAKTRLPQNSTQKRRCVRGLQCHDVQIWWACIPSFC